METHFLLDFFLFHICLDTPAISANIGKNSKIGPSPTKSFWNLTKNNNSGKGFFKSDPILGELTCETCLYQCYGATKMKKHIKINHSVISNVESSSGNPETKKEGSMKIFQKTISSAVCL